MQFTQKSDIVTEQSFYELIEFSKQSPHQSFAIFKHSTRCSISNMALYRMEKSSFFELHNITLHILDILKFRPLSDIITNELGVKHESPQLLIIKNGLYFAHTSHTDITQSWLEKYAK